MSALPLLVQAKGVVTLVEIHRQGMPAVRMADPAVRQFNIWEGPGVGGFRVSDGDGFIV